MIAIITLLCVLSLSIFVTRVATVALAHTGLSYEAARFQARSAFTGVGFTTNESEKVVNHPVRRRILMALMLVGNAGIVTAASSLILTFTSLDDPRTHSATAIVALVTGLTALVAVASSDWVDRKFSVLIGWALERFTTLDVRDYDNLLHLNGEYRVVELYVEPDDWLAEKALSQLDLRGEGVNVLGIQRAGGTYEGNPDGDTEVRAGDVLIGYGRVSALRSLDTRRRGWAGDVQHRLAIREQECVEAGASPQTA